MASASHSALAHDNHDHGSDHDDGRVHVHVAPIGFYVGIFAALIFLTFVTVGVSYYDFGAANAVIAVVIATMKASLVATFFMHLNHDKIFHTIVLLSSVLFLLIFVFFTAEDVGNRGRVEHYYGGHDDLVSGKPAAGGMPVVDVPAAPAHHGEPEGKAHH